LESCVVMGDNPVIIDATLVECAPVAQPAGYAEKSAARPHTSPDLIKAGLGELGVPRGLAAALAAEDARIGVRIYLLDNSGSTAAMDGTVLQQSGNGFTRQTSSRWDEVCAMALNHAKWNLATGVPTEFILLNSISRPADGPLQDGRDLMTVTRDKGPQEEQVALLKNFLDRNGPRGVTPISARIQDVKQRIKTVFSEMVAQGNLVFFVLVTDGLPTSPTAGECHDSDKKEFVQSLRSLATEYPVQLVVRLCTDETEIAKFYAEIDKELEMPVDILDDPAAEGRELAKNGNAWLTYTPVLHRMREAGTLTRVFDTVDERALQPPEIVKLVQLVSDSPVPLPEDPKQFIAAVDALIRQKPQVFDCVRGQMGPFVDIGGLRSAMGVSGGCCAVL